MLSSSHATVIDLVLQAGPVVKLVLILLLFFSIVSWAVIFLKYRQFRSAERASQIFLRQFAKASRLDEVFQAAKQSRETPLAVLVQEGFSRMDSGRTASPKEIRSAGSEDGPRFASDARPSDGRENRREMFAGVERTLRYTIQDEMTFYGNYLGFLATTGNVTPFIGLFGTVWGILNAFHQIGIQGTANIAAVAPGIAEALVATAAGLAAAIPAVIAYNYFVNRMRKLSSQLEVFSGELLDFMEQEASRSRSSHEVMTS